MNPEYLRPGEAATRLGVTTATLTRWAHVEDLLTVHREGDRGMRRYAAREVTLLVDVRHWKATAVDLDRKLDRLQRTADHLRQHNTRLTAQRDAARRRTADADRALGLLLTMQQEITHLRSALADAQRARDYLAAANVLLQERAS